MTPRKASRQLPLDPEEAARARARAANLQIVKKIQKRANEEEAVLRPCLAAYEEQIEGRTAPEDLLRDLTAPLLAAFEETRASIERRMRRKWEGNPEQAASSIVNSLRRSAGTNYQGLVSYALALFLLERGSAWYLQHPVPKALREALAITFTAGVPIAPEPEDGDLDDDELVAEDELDEVAKAAKTSRVQPDVDILLRNGGWDEGRDEPEPVVLLSVKTSLADRAGMAARWKTYFDQATHPCPHHELPGCAYSRLGITMEDPDRFDILHGIVTANIYKYRFHDERYHKGELASGQTRSNTYMFDLKLTTREDEKAETPADWRPFVHLTQVLSELSERHHLPQ